MTRTIIGRKPYWLRTRNKFSTNSNKPITILFVITQLIPVRIKLVDRKVGRKIIENIPSEKREKDTSKYENTKNMTIVNRR